VKTLVLGLGNPILTDDGVGVRVAEAVRAALAASSEAGGSNGAAPYPEHIDITEVSVGGLTLMETMVGYDRVILIDAFEGDGLMPGQMRRMTLDDLCSVSPTQHSASPHDASLVTALELGRRMGLALPGEIIIYAIGIENVMDFSDQPTPAVAAAIPQATTAVLAELRRDM
jgi:hydrogenase maturation protease